MGNFVDKQIKTTCCSTILGDSQNELDFGGLRTKLLGGKSSAEYARVMYDMQIGRHLITTFRAHQGRVFNFDLWGVVTGEEMQMMQMQNQQNQMQLWNGNSNYDQSTNSNVSPSSSQNSPNRWSSNKSNPSQQQQQRGTGVVVRNYTRSFSDTYGGALLKGAGASGAGWWNWWNGNGSWNLNKGWLTNPSKSWSWLAENISWRMTSQALLNKQSSDVVKRQSLSQLYWKEDIDNCYTVLTELGKGSFGTVYEWRHKHMRNFRAAIKSIYENDDPKFRPSDIPDYAMQIQNSGQKQGEEIDPDQQTTTNGQSQAQAQWQQQQQLQLTRSQQSKNKKIVQAANKNFRIEISILESLDHPHIVKLYEVHEFLTNRHLVLELCHGGELYNYVAKLALSGRHVRESTAKYIFYQQTLALSYLHANLIVHRDVKTENWLFLFPPSDYEHMYPYNSGEEGTTSQQSQSQKHDGNFHRRLQDTIMIKLCDFGTAVKLKYPTESAQSNQRFGTLSYAAPEIYTSQGASLKSDVWSLGVCLFVLTCGCSPFRTTGGSKTQWKKWISQSQNSSPEKLGDGSWQSPDHNSSTKAATVQWWSPGQPGPQEVKDTVERIKEGNYDESKTKHLSEQCKAVIKRMLTVQLWERPTSKEILQQCDWFYWDKCSDTGGVFQQSQWTALLWQDSSKYNFNLHWLQSQYQNGQLMQQHSDASTKFSDSDHNNSNSHNDLVDAVRIQQSLMPPANGLEPDIILTKQNAPRNSANQGGAFYNPVMTPRSQNMSPQREHLHQLSQSWNKAVVLAGGMQYMGQNQHQSSGTTNGVGNSNGHQNHNKNKMQNPITGPCRNLWQNFANSELLGGGSWQNQMNNEYFEEVAANYQVKMKYAPELLRLLILFSQCNSLQRMALVACARSIGDEVALLNTTLPWYHLFVYLDSDKDGAISVDEFVKCLSQWLFWRYQPPDNDSANAGGISPSRIIQGAIKLFGGGSGSGSQQSINESAVGGLSPKQKLTALDLNNVLRSSPQSQQGSYPTSPHAQVQHQQYQQQHLNHNQQSLHQPQSSQSIAISSMQKSELEGQLTQIVEALDVNRSGKIEWSEFLALERLTQRKEALLGWGEPGFRVLQQVFSDWGTAKFVILPEDLDDELELYTFRESTVGLGGTGSGSGALQGQSQQNQKSPLSNGIKNNHQQSALGAEADSKQSLIKAQNQMGSQEIQLQQQKQTQPQPKTEQNQLWRGKVKNNNDNDPGLLQAYLIEDSVWPPTKGKRYNKFEEEVIPIKLPQRDNLMQKDQFGNDNTATSNGVVTNGLSNTAASVSATQTQIKSPTSSLGQTQKTQQINLVNGHQVQSSNLQAYPKRSKSYIQHQQQQNLKFSNPNICTSMADLPVAISALLPEYGIKLSEPFTWDHFSKIIDSLKNTLQPPFIADDIFMQQDFIEVVQLQQRHSQQQLQQQPFSLSLPPVSKQMQTYSIANSGSVVLEASSQTQSQSKEKTDDIKDNINNNSPGTGTGIEMIGTQLKQNAVVEF